MNKQYLLGWLMVTAEDGRNTNCFKHGWHLFLKKLFCKKASGRTGFGETEEEEDFPWENPYVHKLRIILEQVLPRYQISYREFRPLLIDTDTPPESLLDEDQVEVLLEQISEDLNFLRIVTDRPAYFAGYIQRMYEDDGLVVQLCPKGEDFSADTNDGLDSEERLSASNAFVNMEEKLSDVNVVLDMEQQGECPLKQLREDMLYIPLYKRRWCPVENMGNLDISIPIGYNTVIVKGVL